jgi:16S rRNA (cytosine967-C5)-methyltransferase
LTTPERRLALDVLRGIARSRQTLGDLLAQPDIERLDPQARGFLHELVLGTLRHRGALDHALASVSSRPLAETDPVVLDALRLGVYQLLRMRVPDHAAVSETVELLRDVGSRAGGFANAVLRNLTRRGAPATPDPQSDPLGWMTTTGSLPRWLAERWIRQEGAATAVERARALLEPAPLTFRINPRRPDAAERVREAGLEPQALTVPDAWTATAGRPVDLAREGLIYLMDMGSQLVARLAAANGRVLDACAAPGGKSLLMADAEPRAFVAALDIAPRRLRTMAGLVGTWRATNVTITSADALRPPFRPASFGSVLLDAPCSGLGTLGRNPDLRWRSTAEDVVRQAVRQGRLIRAVADLVKPGGRLVYSACTLEPEETESVVRSFLAERPDFTPLPAPDWAASFVDRGFLRVRPEKGPGDGFFAALLGRR